MNYSNENFTFSPCNMDRIRSLNAKLKKEEERIKLFAIQLNATLKKQVLDKQIDDYNIGQRLCLFSFNPDCNTRHNVEEGDPIAEESTLLLFDENTEEFFYTDNWNEFRADNNHPLANEFFCYSMHCLLFHGSLTFQDIVDIDEIWIELKVDYQFIVGNERPEEG